MLLLVFGLGSLDRSAMLAGDVISLILIGAGAPLTHTRAGVNKIGYRFYQPFSGGATFVILQIVGWICYGLSLIVMVTHLVTSWRGTPRIVFFLAANILGIISQTFLNVAVLFYDPSRINRRPWHDIAVFNILVASVPVALFVVNEFAFVSAGETFLTPGLRLAATLILFCAAPLTHITAVGLDKSGSRLGAGSLQGWRGSSDLEDSQTEGEESAGPVSPSTPPRTSSPAVKGRGEARRLQAQRKNLQEEETEGVVAAAGKGGAKPRPRRRLGEEKSARLAAGAAGVPSDTPRSPTNGATSRPPAVLRKQSSRNYSLFQPFMGGEVFVFLQIVGWVVYSIGLVLVLSFLFFDVVFPFYHWVVGAGGLIAQGFLLGSLFVFERSRGWREFKVYGSMTLEEVQQAIVALWVTGFFYQIPLLTLLGMISVFLVLPFREAFIIMSLSLVVYMSRVNQKDSETGARRWDWFTRQTWLWDSMARYFRAQLFVEPDQKKRPQPDRVYLFAFHPHGIYPATCFWTTLGSEWQRLMPGVKTNIAGASIIYRTPVVRDVVMWAGGVEVTRKAITSCISRAKSVMIVPGGQREMRTSSHTGDVIKVSSRNKGFVRIAMQFGVPLVPVLSFGEDQILLNIRLPAIQEFFYTRIGFNFPHFPYGRWYLPIPNQVKISVAVGEPLEIPLIESPTDEEIDHYHKLYFERLQELFNKWKVKADFGRSQLVLNP